MCFLVLLTQERSPPPLGCFPTTLTQTSSALKPAVVAGPAAASDGGALSPASVLRRHLQTGPQGSPGRPSGQDSAPGGQPNLLGVCPQLDPTPTASQPRRPQTVQAPLPRHTPLPETPHRPHPPPTLTCFPAPSLPLPPPLSPPALPPPQPKHG